MEASGQKTPLGDAAGNSLKMAKNENVWGVLKTAAGGSKMAQKQVKSWYSDLEKKFNYYHISL